MTQSAGSPTKPGAADAKPAAATSSTSPQLPKPATRLSTPLQAPSPEIDIDVNGMSPELDGHSEDVVMGSVAGEEGNGDSEAIIRQLEKSLPRWEGFGNLGWMSDVSKVSDYIY